MPCSVSRAARQMESSVPRTVLSLSRWSHKLVFPPIFPFFDNTTTTPIVSSYCPIHTIIITIMLSFSVVTALLLLLLSVFPSTTGFTLQTPVTVVPRSLSRLSSSVALRGDFHYRNSTLMDSGGVVRNSNNFWKTLTLTKEKQQEQVAVTQQSQDASSSTTSSSLSETSTITPRRVMLREILALGVPALGGLLVDPVMSLVDTASVGQVSSIQLASLAPGTSICQFLFTACLFLSAATTNLVAASSSSSSSKDAQKQQDYQETVISSACVAAVMVGTLLATILTVWTDPLLTLAGCPSPELLHYGRQYLRIRAWGMPFSLVATVLQGAALGLQDAWTPLKIFVSAGVLNLVGDVWLTLYQGWGVRGAALATVASQAAAALYFVYHCRKSNNNNKKNTNKASSFRLAWHGLPSRPMLRSFGTVAGTLLLRALGNMATYSCMTQAAARLGNPLSLAAHQVTLTVWWLFSYLPEPTSVAAQSLLARDRAQGSSQHHVQTRVRLLAALSLGLGGVAALLTGLVLGVPALASGLVADPAVRTIVQRTVPYAMLAQIVCSLGSLSDGVCVGTQHLQHVPYATTAAALLLVATLRYGSSAGVPAIWAASLVYFVGRFALNVLPQPNVRRLFFGKRSSQEQVQQQQQAAAAAA